MDRSCILGLMLGAEFGGRSRLLDAKFFVQSACQMRDAWSDLFKLCRYDVSELDAVSVMVYNQSSSASPAILAIDSSC